MGRTCRALTNVRSHVKAFYLRDDVSLLTTSKKDTTTSKIQKEQRRLMTDSMKNLHSKFLGESSCKVSYAFFCKERPFWVVVPTERDRDTCLCKTHEHVIDIYSLKSANICVSLRSAFLSSPVLDVPLHNYIEINK